MNYRIEKLANFVNHTEQNFQTVTNAIKIDLQIITSFTVYAPFT